jgi:pilus assembly protein CpaE
MQQLNTAVISSNEEQRLILALQVNGTGLATTVVTSDTLPISTKDEALRRLEDAAPAVVLLDISSQEARIVPQVIELILTAVPSTTVFVVGDISQPASIIDAMRAGAKEYLGRPTNTAVLSDAFLRISSQRKRTTAATGERGKIFAFLNAKGGCGSTTIAVNTGLALLPTGSVLIVDLAILGHVALQLNLKPAFTVRDALMSLHRLDDSLLQSIVTRHSSGVHVLAGNVLLPNDCDAAALASLLDTLASSYRHVILDLSTRLDVVAQTAADNADQIVLVSAADVPSLWSAARVSEHLITSRKRMRLVLNRFRKIPGLTDSDVEDSTSLSVFSKIPNHYATVASSIDRGIPVCHQNHSEISRSFSGLAEQLIGNGTQRKFDVGSLFSKVG